MVMLVVTVWFCSDDYLVSEVFRKAFDPRLCVLITQGRPTNISSVKEWEDGARGGHILWDKAEKVVKRYRDKGIPGVAVGSM